MSFKRLSLTDIKCENMPRCPRTKNLNKAITEADVEAKWAATSWAKKRAAKAKRANLTDLERFKVMLLRKKKAAILSKSKKAMPKSAPVNRDEKW